MRIRKNKEGRTFETYIGWPLILDHLRKREFDETWWFSRISKKD